MIRRFLFPLGSALVLSALVAGPAWAGPPWISIEYPANPHDPATRGAYFILRTYHHGTAMEYRPSGTAEGLVNGRRQSVRLEIVETDKPGVYAVRYTPGRDGAWVLAINAGNAGHENSFGILVSVNRQGLIGTVKVPSRSMEGGRWTVPQAVTPQDIEAALRAQVAAVSGADGDGDGIPFAAAALLLALAGVPVVLRKR